MKDMMAGLSFAFIITPRLESAAVMLAESIRAFGGSLSNSPLQALLPETDGKLSEATGEQLAALGVRLIPFEIAPEVRQFPFAVKALAAAAAGSQADAQADFLVWMDVDSIVIREPRQLILDQGKNLGCRPVDHTNIGSPYDKPVDAFWELIYQGCGVSENRVFPVTGTVDQARMRAYFNAGLLVVRRGSDLLQQWRENFLRLCREACFEEFYQQDERYRIFVHQAVLAGTILARMERQEIQELPHLVNYPLHMHNDYPVDLRPKVINDLITFRYGDMDKPDWAETLPIQEPLKSWITQRLQKKGSA